MNLTLAERFAVLSCLPEAGNFATLKILRQVREALAPSEREIEQYEIVPDGATVRWNPTKMRNSDGTLVTVNIKVTPTARKLIVDGLQKLNSEEKLTEQHYSIYEKFVEPNGELEPEK